MLTMVEKYHLPVFVAKVTNLLTAMGDHGEMCHASATRMSLIDETNRALGQTCTWAGTA
jgi:hypothetical protein